MRLVSRLVVAAVVFLPLSVPAQEAAALLEETKKTALPLLPKVVGMMQKSVKENGAAGAIPVCKEMAPALLADLRQQTGWEIRRVSLKTRNAKTGTPDLWEARQLADFNIRVAAGARPDQMEVSEVVSEPDGRRYFRYMKGLPVVEVCTQCHGPRDSLPEDLKAALDKGYPLDQAIGYGVGQIRGALTVKRPL